MLFESVNLWMLNRISRLTSALGNKVRSLIIFACFVIIGAVFSLYPQSIYDQRRMSMISLIVLIAIVVSVKGGMKAVKWNRLPAMTIELFAIYILVIRPIHPVGQGYLIFAFDILILFPMLYIALLNMENQTWFVDMLSYAVVVTGIICFVFSMILAHGEGSYVLNGRMAGAAKNPNYYGMVGLALTVSGLYNIAREHSNMVWRIIVSVSAGIGISMIMSSVSRTALLSAVVCFIVFIIFIIKEAYLHHSKKRITVFVALVFLMVVFAAASLKLQQSVAFGIQEDNDTGSSHMHFITIITEVYAEDDTEDIPEDGQSTIVDRFSTDTDINEFSSGRIRIWNRYFEYLNIAGNDYDAAKESGAFEGLPESRAHNNIIDYAYRFGIPAGLLYAVFYFAIIVKAAVMTFGRKRFTATDMWVVMTVAAYAIYAMVEISTLPFTRYIPCLFFLSAAPLMAGPPEEAGSETESES